MPETRLASSFRDPSGFVFRDGGKLFRQINRSYQKDFELLHSSGLYEELTAAELLIPHRTADLGKSRTDEAIAIIEPEIVTNVSYPYEWCFSQLKDAALTTLDIQRRALDKGMALKDASAFNIQFHKGKPTLIDTLSFEKYKEGQPWIAYRQFCQHFLAPLALMSTVDARLNLGLRDHIDGIPLDLASKLVPWKTRLNFGLFLHLHVHTKAQTKLAEPQTGSQNRTISKVSLLGLVDSLRSAINGLRWNPTGTTWSDYYSNTNYTDAAMEEKKRLVGDYLDLIAPAPTKLWDLGANTGEFSRIGSAKGIDTVAWDIDPAAVEKNYRAMKAKSEAFCLPLVQDLTNPSPSLGWALKERQSLTERGPVDAVMALALVHHMAIANNVPLSDVAAFFASLGGWLIIEFVPKEDSQVQRLLAGREDIFDYYTQAYFERDFSAWFDIVRKDPISGTKRTLYLMRTVKS